MMDHNFFCMVSFIQMNIGRDWANALGGALSYKSNIHTSHHQSKGQFLYGLWSNLSSAMSSQLLSWWLNSLCDFLANATGVWHCLHNKIVWKLLAWLIFRCFVFRCCKWVTFICEHTSVSLLSQLCRHILQNFSATEIYTIEHTLQMFEEGSL